MGKTRKSKMGCGSSVEASPRQSRQYSDHEKVSSAPEATIEKAKPSKVPIEAPTPASTPTSLIEAKESEWEEKVPLKTVPKSESKREEKMKRLSQSGIARSSGPRVSAEFLQRRRSTLRRTVSK